MSDYEALKTEVLNSSRWLCDQGYFGGKLGSGGNVSLFLRSENLVVITPSRKPYRSMTAGDICVVDSQLKLVDGHLPPSMESSMHLAIYQNRTDIDAVVHSHQVYASVLALINQPIPALFDEISLEIGPEVAIVPYALSGSGELAANVVSRLQNGGRCYIIQNHGALCLGKNLTEAMRNAEYLEKVAQVYVNALHTGREISRLPESAVGQLMAMRRPS